jgi:hypothetical protein
MNVPRPRRASNRIGVSVVLADGTRKARENLGRDRRHH